MDLVSFHAFCKVGKGVGNAVNLCVVFIQITADSIVFIAVAIAELYHAAVWKLEQGVALTVCKTDFILPAHAAPPPEKK